MRFFLLLLLLVPSLALAAGCSTAAGNTASGPTLPADGSDGGATTGDPSGDASASDLACTEGVPAGFAAKPTPFTLPAPRCGQAFDGMSSNGNVAYTMLDVNADRRPDLVVTSDRCDDEIGTKRWDVYLASASGFAKTPTPFALPAARCSEPFDALAGSGNVAYTMLDANADRRPDLVVTSDRCDDEIGTKRWDVYLASDAGFAMTPTAFTLPAARCKEPFDSLAGTGSVRYTLLDVDGDRRSDLVVTSDTCDADVGTKRWDVYAAESTGFAKTPSTFALPAKRCQTDFDSVAGRAQVGWALLDVNADKRPDLVVTSDSCDDEVGSKHWDVYVASSAGFAKAPSTFILPATRCSEPFDNLSSNGNVSYSLLDLSCDGRPDLLVTGDTCDEDVGAKRWDVYVASDAGFSKTASKLTLPSARCGERFDALAKSGNVPYGLLDVSADSRGDLLVTSDTCDEDVGKNHWDAYALE